MKFPRWAIWLLAPLPLAVAGGYLSSKLFTGAWVYILGRVNTGGLDGMPELAISEIKKYRLADIKNAVNLLYLPPPPQVTRVEEPAQETSQKPPEKPPEYTVIFTYVGLLKSYAIINGRLLKEGDMVSNEERIIKIKRDGVLLSGRWGKRWIKVLK